MKNIHVIQTEKPSMPNEPKKERMYSEKEVALIVLEMVTWVIDNIQNTKAITGIKFDEVINKYKNK